MKKQLRLPKFDNEDQERDFWNKISLADYFEAKDLKNVDYPNLKPTTKSISIRVPVFLLKRLKQEANELSIPYQALIKQYIKKGLML